MLHGDAQTFSVGAWDLVNVSDSFSYKVYSQFSIFDILAPTRENDFDGNFSPMSENQWERLVCCNCFQVKYWHSFKTPSKSNSRSWCKIRPGFTLVFFQLTIEMRQFAISEWNHLKSNIYVFNFTLLPSMFLLFQNFYLFSSNLRSLFILSWKTF